MIETWTIGPKIADDFVMEAMFIEAYSSAALAEHSISGEQFVCVGKHFK